LKALDVSEGGKENLFVNTIKNNSRFGKINGRNGGSKEKRPLGTKEEKRKIEEHV